MEWKKKTFITKEIDTEKHFTIKGVKADDHIHSLKVHISALYFAIYQLI